MLSIARVFTVLFATVTLAGCAASTDDVSDAPGESAEELTSRFSSKKAPANKNLAAFYAANHDFENPYRGVYRFNKATNEAYTPSARLNRVKEVMHRYMCSFFDESIDIGKSSTVKQVEQDLDFYNNAPDDDAREL